MDGTVSKLNELLVGLEVSCPRHLCEVRVAARAELDRYRAFLRKLAGPGMRDVFEQRWNDIADEAAALLMENSPR